MRTIKFLVVHCTATPPTTAIESIQTYWKEIKKWNNPGYHYIIKRNGEIICLQTEDMIANGVAGFNKSAIHISYIGGIDKDGKPLDNRTDAQQRAMYDKLIELSGKYPNAEIRGHRDFSPDKNGNGTIEIFEQIKHCPSFDVKQWLIDYIPDELAA